MKLKALILFAALTLTVQGQEKSKSESGDARTFIIQSQIVEYRPILNRDPFSTPTESIVTNPGNELIDDITVLGTAVLNNKSHVVALDVTKNVRSFPVGYRFKDGVITAITDSEVIFSQWDPESGNPSTGRTVRRTIRQEGR